MQGTRWEQIDLEARFWARPASLMKMKEGHIGDLTIVAIKLGLWSDPSVWEHGDDLISVSWGGNTARLWRNPDGSWTANILPDVLRGKARVVT